jgi:hypothetical protein
MKALLTLHPLRLGRVVDILEASGAFDPGSNPGRGVLTVGQDRNHFFTYPPGKNDVNSGLSLAKVTTNGV